MKYILVISIISFSFLSHSIELNAQDSKLLTAKIKVEGVCDQCKIRIENAAYIKGVKKSEWNKESGLLTVIFKSTKTDQSKIEKSIASSGHDTENEKASTEAYKKLPQCCAYRDGVEKH